jgi:hypothetical protein
MSRGPATHGLPLHRHGIVGGTPANTLLPA